MSKVVPHPKAYLTMKRNVRRGLLTRTQIILILEKETLSVKEVAERIGLRYASILHHLHLLETERILLRKGKRPYFWELTGAGQQRLTNESSRE